MHKRIVTAAAVLGMIHGLIFSTAAAADPGDRYSYHPEGSLYLSYGFGGPASKTLPLHYGLRMQYDGSPLALARLRDMPPLLTLDFDAAGSGVAMFTGIPFMRHIAKLDQNDNAAGDSEEQTRPGGLTVVDWGLLGLGVAGIGYGISQVARSNNSSDPQSSNNPNNGTGGLLGGILGGGGAKYTAVNAGENPQLLLLNGSRVLVFGSCEVGRPDPTYMNWLNGGTGQMGDLNRQR